MTPEQLTALAALLLNLRDWLDETDPGTLDAAIVDRCVTVCADRRRELVRTGAR